MELITYSLRTVAKAIIEPTYLLMLIVFGIIFYLKNKKTVWQNILSSSLYSIIK